MSVKDKVRQVLATSHPGEDVGLFAFGIPYGFWVWDEETSQHVALKATELEDEVRLALPRVHLTKQDVFPNAK